MPQYLCAVNMNHMKYFALPVGETLRCCGKPMIEQGAHQPAPSTPQPAVVASAGALNAAKRWWQFWK